MQLRIVMSYKITGIFVLPFSMNVKWDDDGFRVFKTRIYPSEVSEYLMIVRAVECATRIFR